MLGELESLHPDAIQVHGLWKYTSLAVHRAASRVSCPYVVHPHGMLDSWAVRNSSWKKRLASWAYERRHLEQAACIRALNCTEAEAIRRYGLQNPICVIPNGVDLPPQDSLEDPPWSGAIDSRRRILLYLGRIHPKKGLPNLMRAWALVRESAKEAANWALVVAGWDQDGHEAELKRLCQRLDLPWSNLAGTGSPHSLVERSQSVGTDFCADTMPCILFLGPQFGKAKDACYRHADAFVLPSFSEGLPMVVLEAWSHSKAVLMTPGCNLPDGYAQGAALRIESSPDSIAAGLSACLEMSNDERLAIGKQGYRLAKSNYSWPVVAQQLREVYSWIIGGGPPPNCVEII
jgi:poly(glycerol-phosphate) alpha-glucosyltransferase